MKSIAVAAALLLVASCAFATVLEIPLPGLLGTYQNASRTATIVLPGQPSVIHGASIRIAGVTSPGQLDCTVEGGGFGPFWTDFLASMKDDSPSKFWIAGGDPTATGVFSLTRPFDPVFGATWSFLMDGVGDITLDGNDPLSFCNVVSSCSSLVTEAVFIIDAEFPIAVQPSTWGRIKALYR